MFTNKDLIIYIFKFGLVCFHKSRCGDAQNAVYDDNNLVSKL